MMPQFNFSYCVRMAQLALVLFVTMFFLSAYVAHATTLNVKATHSLESAISMVRWNSVFIVLFTLSIGRELNTQHRYIHLVGVSMCLVLLASLMFAGPIGLKYLFGIDAISFITPYSSIFFILGYIGFIIALSRRITLNANRTGNLDND
jgi:uncharacterized membrane protein YgdD (TMEM256/DUF423 family)